MRTIVLTAIVWVLLLAPAHAQTLGPDGYWVGTLSEAGANLSVTVSFQRSVNGSWSGRFTSMTQGIIEYPFDSVSVHAAAISFVLGGGDITLRGTIGADHIEGSFTGNEGKGAFVLRRSTQPNYPYRSQTISFRNGTVRLAGSLYTPRSKGRHPAVILLHGSGPQSRWGTHRFLADRLARAGIATLIYDKRGSGDSGGDWRATYDDLAGDASAAVRVLQSRSDINAAQIGLWGHSQGGYLAPLITARTHSVAFIVAADSAAMPQYQQDIYRVNNEVRDSGWTGKTGQAAMTLYKQFIMVARTGKGYAQLAHAMQLHKKDAWLDWMGIPPRNNWVWAWYRKTGDFDPRPFWAQVTVPVLLVFGERDELVPVDGSITEIEKIMNTHGNQDVQAFILPEAPHTLHIAPKTGGHFFWWHLVPGYPGLVIDWMKARTY